MRRVNCSQDYGKWRVAFLGKDLCTMDVPSSLIPIDMGLPNVEFDKVDKTADQTCQDLLDEQGKAKL